MAADVYGEKDDLTYYRTNGMEMRADAQYNAADYDMELKLGRQLKAQVTMTVDKTSLSEYNMTLYHGYRIKSITDENGNKLDYTRNGDYVTVKNNEKLFLNKIRISYSGYSANFYSNSQAVYLPGYFPYYPQPGFHTVFTAFTYEKYALEEPAKFNIKINAPYKVYSNLKENNGNFIGATDAPTLISGFINEIDINGTNVIYSLFDEGGISEDLIITSFEETKVLENSDLKRIR